MPRTTSVSIPTILIAAAWAGPAAATCPSDVTIIDALTCSSDIASTISATADNTQRYR